jgi:hypothetical protein
VRKLEADRTIEGVRLAAGNRLELAAAHEVNDFEAVVRLNRGLLPFRARENIEIALDGHSIRSHLEVLKQCGNGKPIRNFAKLAVNSNLHGRSPSLIRGFLIRRLP